MVHASGYAVQVLAAFAEMLHEEGERLTTEVQAGADAQRLYPARRHRADAMELADLKVLNERRSHPRRDDEQPVRLAVIRRQLGKELIV